MILELKNGKQSAADALSDKVYAAMETGNPAGAREALAAAPEDLDGRCTTLRIEIQQKYGIRL